MSKAKIAITEEIAERIINSRVVIEESAVPYKGIEVTSVTFNDTEGNPFLWEESEEPYAIVNLKATNMHLLGLAVDEFEAGNFEESTNFNLSMRMNVDKAKDVQQVGSGTLVCHEVVLEDGSVALLAKTFNPAVAIVGKKVALAEMLAKRKANKEEAPIQP